MIERYSRPELAAMWSDTARFALWLDIELAVCEAMEARGYGRAGRTRAPRQRWTRVDQVTVVASIAVVAVA